MKYDREPPKPTRNKPLCTAAILAAMLLAVSACGQRGPLFLPDDSAAGKNGKNGEQHETGNDSKDEENKPE